MESQHHLLWFHHCKSVCGAGSHFGSHFGNAGGPLQRLASSDRAGELAGVGWNGGTIGVGKVMGERQNGGREEWLPETLTRIGSLTLFLLPFPLLCSP